MSKLVKKIIHFRKSKWTYNLEIQGFDEERISDRNFLLDLLIQLSHNKTVFMSFFMGSINTINNESILFSDENSKEKYHGKLQVNLTKFDMSEKIFENRTTTFYIFDQSVTWNDFLQIKDPFSNKNFKENNLLSIINIYDLDGINITLKKDRVIELNDILKQFHSQGYSIKKSTLI